MAITLILIAFAMYAGLTGYIINNLLGKSEFSDETNSILMNRLSQQQDYINSLSAVIQTTEDKLKEIDATGAFEADDEVGFFFKNIKEIQTILNEFNISKNE